MKFLQSYSIESPKGVYSLVQEYKTHSGIYIITHKCTKGSFGLWVIPDTIYRDPATGLIIAGVKEGFNTNDTFPFLGVVIVYPDKGRTKRYIKGMSVNQAVQQFIFKSNENP